ncbi:MAG: hypothetical protein QW087_00645 [Methanomassiliicoccales archaeon]
MSEGSRISESFTRPIIMMFIATIVAGSCDYIYQIIMGRQLGPAGYSELNAMLSIFYIISVPTQTIAAFVVRHVSKYKAQDNDEAIRWLVRKTLLISFFVGLIIAVGICATVPTFTRFASLSSSLPLFILMIGTVIVLMSPAGYGTVQGLQKFHLSALCAISGPVAKLFFGVLLVFAGFSTNGAFGAAIIGVFFTFVVGIVFIRNFLRQKARNENKPDLSHAVSYLAKAIVAVVCFSILINIDVFMARRYLGPYDAGVYTVASILSKVIWFLPGAVSTVMFPRVSEFYTRNKETAGVLRRAIFYTLCITGLVALAYVVIPDRIIVVFYGDTYLDAAPALSVLGIAMTLFGLSSLFMNYSLAIESRAYIAIFCFFTALEIILIMTFHTTMISIAYDLFIASAGILSLSWLYFEIKTREMRRNKNKFQEPKIR